VDTEERKLLEEALTLAKENNKMLHSMRRSMIFGRVMSFIYWALIIGSAVGAYYYIQPYIDQLLGVYGGAKSNLDSINSVLKNLQN
jgi:hypothetical protein